uniref:NADH dehydrogenase [ubiquinone] 1 alpha subcomplex assembly factor 3 n=1 Tax=Attheya septentrionalis TaxID=420275 RepID=A0A7S2XSB0_9STRA|mmetsp:Transcript_7067/g.12683  ORF Transcript_7067/g.12683 Transcript_7067/m.12683 type:complete len:259 (+) Transcript_7067:116-892(+)|eukprot:CAMPEP_0198295692 /NCGR_PEP_ID=MMETSP1449-20131203/29071_1 /TAXON_ID=420275 /ORGANISM="Attheya septentrionalis, Strain CCMP2084" /LENGTH=258 /DNA_ID=CAMNT_0043996075 /DNA_START=60 /DNA_END=836 /DNA_ORIENTATION=-
MSVHGLNMLRIARSSSGAVRGYAKNPISPAAAAYHSLAINGKCRLGGHGAVTRPTYVRERGMADCRGMCLMQRGLSSYAGRGTDLLADSLAFGERPKIILDSYAPSGFDIFGLMDRPIQAKSTTEKSSDDENSGEIETYSQNQGVVHMNGSILAFPHSCFLWKVSSPRDVTLASLAAVMTHDPPVEFLFIGCNKPLPPRELNKIKNTLSKDKGIVVEQMDVMNAMGTFNVLNGEDRRVAVALVLEDEEKADTSQRGSN